MRTELLQPQIMSSLQGDSMSLLSKRSSSVRDKSALVQIVPDDTGSKTFLQSPVLPLAVKNNSTEDEKTATNSAQQPRSYPIALKCDENPKQASNSHQLKIETSPPRSLNRQENSSLSSSSDSNHESEESPKWKTVQASPTISKVPKLSLNSAEPKLEVGRLGLTRSQSTPVGESRRTIFDSFWKKEEGIASGGDEDSQSVNSTKSTGPARSSSRYHRRARSNSVTIPDSPGTVSRNYNDDTKIMMFSPPVKHTSALLSHFERLDQLPLPQRQTLPPLPSPLQRICQNSDGTGCSGGMYPLTSERPVLHRSCYGQIMTKEEQKRQQHLLQDKSFQLPLRGAPLASNLPLSVMDSIKPQHKQFERKSFMEKNKDIVKEDNEGKDVTKQNSENGDISKEGSCDDLVETASTESSSSMQQLSRKIRFDPRVTITEYDDHAPRQWYSEAELEKLKFETIELVQRFLLQNPHVAAEYCVGTVDPVTGAIRKKTLYSLPILNCTDDNDSSSEAKGKEQSDSPFYNYSNMAHIHVRRVLVVEPNKLILDLFCKSLRQIFPHAKLVPVQSGEEALNQVKRTFKEDMSQATMPRGFDLVIVEERLHPLPPRRYGHSLQQARATDGMPPKGQHQKSLSAGNLPVHQHSSMTCLADYHKFYSHSESIPNIYLSGSEVIRRICQLEGELFRPDRCILEGEESNEETADNGPNNTTQQPQICWRSLLIGVCVDQLHDAERLRQNGADIVWGKPPPHMGEMLRNQLVSLLIGKRNPSSFPGPIHPS